MPISEDLAPTAREKPVSHLRDTCVIPILVLAYPTETSPALKERAGDRPNIKIRTSNSQASPAGETRT